MQKKPRLDLTSIEFNPSFFLRTQDFYKKSLIIVCFLGIVLAVFVSPLLFPSAKAGFLISVQAKAQNPFSKAELQQIDFILSNIAFREKAMGLFLSGETPIEENDEGFCFLSQILVPGVLKEPRVLSKEEYLSYGVPYVWTKPQYSFRVRNSFLKKSDTVEQGVTVDQGHEHIDYHMKLEPNGQRFVPRRYRTKEGDVLIYSGQADTLIYRQNILPDGSVSLKEWIYARVPNSTDGSRYVWQFENAAYDWSHYVTVEENRVGSLSLYNNMLIQNIPRENKKEKMRVIGVVWDMMKKVFKGDIYIRDHDEITRISPVTYWTAEGNGKIASSHIVGEDTLEITIEEPPQAYPLLIDPVLIFGFYQ